MKENRGAARARKKSRDKAARLNITLPPTLLEEGMKLVKKHHHNGMSDLLQTLLRDAVVKQSGADDISGPKRRYSADGDKDPEGN